MVYSCRGLCMIDTHRDPSLLFPSLLEYFFNTCLVCWPIMLAYDGSAFFHAGKTRIPSSAGIGVCFRACLKTLANTGWYRITKAIGLAVLVLCLARLRLLRLRLLSLGCQSLNLCKVYGWAEALEYLLTSFCKAGSFESDEVCILLQTGCGQLAWTCLWW